MTDVDSLMIAGLRKDVNIQGGIYFRVYERKCYTSLDD